MSPTNAVLLFAAVAMVATPGFVWYCDRRYNRKRGDR